MAASLGRPLTTFHSLPAPYNTITSTFLNTYLFRLDHSQLVVLKMKAMQRTTRMPSETTKPRVFTQAID